MTKSVLVFLGYTLSNFEENYFNNEGDTKLEGWTKLSTQVYRVIAIALQGSNCGVLGTRWSKCLFLILGQFHAENFDSKGLISDIHFCIE